MGMSFQKNVHSKDQINLEISFLNLALSSQSCKVPAESILSQSMQYKLLMIFRWIRNFCFRYPFRKFSNTIFVLCVIRPLFFLSAISSKIGSRRRDLLE